MRRPPLMLALLPAALLAVLASADLRAQNIPKLRPFANTLDVLVCDSSNDKVWRMIDLNQDGDFNDASEVIDFYDPAIGQISLGNPNDIGIAKNGTAYVCDSSTDIVLWMRDRNGDGRADDPSLPECGVFFTSALNAEGIVMASAMSITVDENDVVWVGVSNADLILRLEDLNGDGDADDANESKKYRDIITGSAGDSIPTEARIGTDGEVYYLENGATGVFPRGVYRLHDDVVVNGNCNDPGEHSTFYVIPPQASNSFLWAMQVGSDGVFWISDYNNNLIVRAEDINGDKTITPGPPEEVFFVGPGSRNTTWGLDVRDDGAVLAAHANPTRLWLYHDLDGSGLIDQPNETIPLYDPALASVAIGTPKSCSFMRDATILATPNPVALGGQLTVLNRYNPGDIGVLMTSPFNLMQPIPLPPFGTLDVDPTIWISLGAVTLDATGLGVHQFPIPSAAYLAGTVYLQGAYINPFRPRFSNMETLIIQ